MHLLLAAEDSEAELRSEISASFPGIVRAEVESTALKPLLLEAEFEIRPQQRLPQLVFARQLLPNARLIRCESIRDWARAVTAEVVASLPDDQLWALHVEAHYGARTTHRIGARAWHTATRCGAGAGGGGRQQAEVVDTASPGPGAGRHRCQLIRESVLEELQKRRRHLLKHLEPAPVPFTSEQSLVQVLLTAPDTGFVSVAVAPVPFEQRHLVSPFPKGFVPIASDKSAPSRAFAKLSEALLRVGRDIHPGETCVDVGAAPGSWTWYAINRGARVIAVDRSPLRDDLMRHRQVHVQTADAFRFAPPKPVDWLLCDVIAPPRKSADLLFSWLKRGSCRNFVVTLKLQDEPGTNVIAELKRQLPPLTRELLLKRLCANKKEVSVVGTTARGQDSLTSSRT